MKPEVVTHKQVSIFWISIVAIAIVSLLLYLYGTLAPSPIPGKQSQTCEGARQSLLELQRVPSNDAAATDAKIKDAKDLAETECAKVD